MKGFIFAVAVCAALLSGCEPASSPSGAAPSLEPVAGTVLVKNKVMFPEGIEVSFNGRIFQYQLVQNVKGEFDRYIVHSTDGMMGVEGAVFASLAKQGYTRRIRKEVPGQFVVNYVKKGAATIIATFSDHSTKAVGDKTKSRAVFTWKIAG
ncbi:hypothetical protein [Pseudomonas peli]|uniref:hypothetical protein n=1 Tax=Pseudomonas peli TaxID=592361 RepID=UPI003D31A27B